MAFKAIFIDKDGTLLEDVPYNVDVNRISFIDGVRESLVELKKEGFRFFLVSNQSGVARGLFPEEALLDVRTRIQEELQRIGVSFDAFYFCPHHPCGIVDKYSIECDCRKPSPGMILQAAREFSINLSESWMVGDILHDVEAGNRAGCRTILIHNGNETMWENGPFRTPDFLVSSWKQVVEVVLKKSIIKQEDGIPEYNRTV